MPSWDELKDYARGKFQLLEEEPTWFGMAWRFPTGDGNFVAQRVKVHATQAFDQPWLLVMADVCPEAQLAPRDALLHNRTLAIGALALDGPLYLMRHATSLASLTWPDFDRLIEFIGHEAARLRLRIAGPTPAAPPPPAPLGDGD